MTEGLSANSVAPSIALAIGRGSPQSGQLRPSSRASPQPCAQALLRNRRTPTFALRCRSRQSTHQVLQLSKVVGSDEGKALFSQRVFDPRQCLLIGSSLRLTTSTYREVEMLSLKAMVRLIATIMLLSIGFVLYPQGSANAAKYCAELRGATATGHPDCSFSSHKACRAHVRAGGGGHCYKLRA